MNPTQNAPTVATLVVAFATTLLNWAAESIDAPAEVEAAGLALAVALVALAAGRITQRYFTDPKGDGVPFGDPDDGGDA